MHFLWWILVGLVAGWATGKIMKGEGYGFIVDTLLGIAGALAGGYIAGLLGFSARGLRRVQNGYVRTYALGMGLGLVVLLAYLTFRTGG